MSLNENKIRQNYPNNFWLNNKEKVYNGKY